MSIAGNRHVPIMTKIHALIDFKKAGVRDDFDG